MTAETTFYRDLAFVFGAAVVGSAGARLLRQPLILGYVVGGMMIGPFTPGPVISDVHQFELLAEIGVILLMYSIGLEFSFRDLLRVKWVAVIGAPLGILLSITLGIGLGWALQWNWQQGVVVGATVSVASTMVLSRFLIERGLLLAEQGQIMIGITLVEDLAVVVLTILLPSLGDITGGRLFALGLSVAKALLNTGADNACSLFPDSVSHAARNRRRQSGILCTGGSRPGFCDSSHLRGRGLVFGSGSFSRWPPGERIECRRTDSEARAAVARRVRRPLLRHHGSAGEPRESSAQIFLCSWRLWG